MNDSNLPSLNLKLEDIKAQVRYKIGDELEEDASCDSTYMISAMDRVGAAIRKAYHWMAPTEKCWLVMDNAGGHGPNEAKLQYKNMLVEKYNIHIIFQIPRSPYTNVLNLGVWMALQAAVKREHYLKRCNASALVNSVMRTWEDGDLDGVITKVYRRLKPVLCNIIEANGANDLVESKRGEKFKNIKLENVIQKMQQQNDETVDLLEDSIICEDDDNGLELVDT